MVTDQKMTASKKKSSAKRAGRKTAPAAKAIRESRNGRFVLFPTEQSTIGRKNIESAVTVVLRRRSS